MAVIENNRWRGSLLKRKLREWPRKFGRIISVLLDKFGFHQFFRNIWRRIIFINLLGLVFLIGGVLYLSEFRASLIELQVKSLEIHGKSIAAVLSVASRKEVGGNRTVQPDYSEGFGDLKSLFVKKDIPSQDLDLLPSFPLDTQKIAPFVRIAVQPTNTRARVYETDGTNVIDSNDFLQVTLAENTEEAENSVRKKGIFVEMFRTVTSWFSDTDIPIYVEIDKDNGKKYAEVNSALTGQQTTILRGNEKGQIIVSVATPIPVGDKILGVLLLSTKGVEIDKAVASAREEIMRISLVAIAVVILASVYLTGTIAGPMRSLSKAAKRVKQSIKARNEIPDLTHRPDEIGQLSGALREMTFALYRRLEAIESFAADVAHEIKNPLTSLKSAAETLPLAKTEENRNRLIEVILNDVVRLNRLITDISSASRLDAELARADKKPLDIVKLTKAISEIFNEIDHENDAEVVVEVAPTKLGNTAFIVVGHEGRLGQVFNNLLQNAVSFTPDNGKVWIRLHRTQSWIEISVEDQGPGIPEDNLVKIFARFYTDRPGKDAFGENSGLGLNISQQIVQAHKGEIWAENRYASSRQKKNQDEQKAKIGARFIVRLPAAFVE